MMEYLGDLAIPVLVALTKIDRIPRGRRETALRQAVADLGLDPDQLIPFSAKTGEGKEVLLDALDHLLSDDTTEAS
jgi:GTP-binding protein